jgi:putative addiction module killer protein
MEVQPNEILRYVTPEGRVPYDDWFYALRDNKIKNIINKRLNRVSLGNWGDYRSLGEGIFELRIDYGPGHRVYFGQVGATSAFVFIWLTASRKTPFFLARKISRTYAVAPHIVFMVRYAALTHPTNRGVA